MILVKICRYWLEKEEPRTLLFELVQIDFYMRKKTKSEIPMY